MNGLIRQSLFGFTVFVVLAGSSWAGWFSFEPNIVILDGTPVSVKLENIAMETAYLDKGDTANADQLVQEEKVYRIKRGKDMTRVEYIKHEKDQGHYYVMVQDESGSKLWADMKGLACVDQEGETRQITEQDLASESFLPLPETVQ